MERRDAARRSGTRRGRTDIRLDSPKGMRTPLVPRFGGGNDRMGRFSEAFARGMGTPWFLVGMSVFVVVWLVYNSVAPIDAQFDPRALNFTLLTLILSLQASYAAPMILLAQNRQDDRDRVQIEQDRQRAERNLADTEYLAREVVALRLAMKDVATKEFLRSELRALLDELDRRDDENAAQAEAAAEDDLARNARDEQAPMRGARDGEAAPAGDERHPLALAVRQALGRVIDPEIRRPITELDMVPRVSARDGRVDIDLRLTIVGCPAATSIERDVRAAASTVPGVGEVAVDVGVMDAATREALITRLRGDRPGGHPFTADSLTRVIAVTSGKGGVGKSTLTANLAVALAAQGLRVGLVDADVFGFSIPGLLGISDAKPTQVGGLIMPPRAHGVAVISIGMFVDARTAVSWRGPMLHRTVQQFLTDVHFGDLDVLLLDMPPGTGDVAISVGQLMPHAEVLVVTTPQRAAADVAERSGLVARQTGQTVIGVVENMAGLAQPDGSVLELFGSGGGAETAARLKVPLLARVPLSIALREGGDAGDPIVLRPGDAAGDAITRLASELAKRGRGLAGRKLGLSPR